MKHKDLLNLINAEIGSIIQTDDVPDELIPKDIREDIAKQTTHHISRNIIGLGIGYTEHSDGMREIRRMITSRARHLYLSGQFGNIPDIFLRNLNLQPNEDRAIVLLMQRKPETIPLLLPVFFLYKLQGFKLTSPMVPHIRNHMDESEINSRLIDALLQAIRDFNPDRVQGGMSRQFLYHRFRNALIEEEKYRDMEQYRIAAKCRLATLEACGESPFDCNGYTRYTKSELADILRIKPRMVDYILFRHSIGSDIYTDEDGRDASIFDDIHSSYHIYADPQIAAVEKSAVINLVEIRLMEETTELDPYIFDAAATALPRIIQKLLDNEEPLRVKKEGHVQANKADVKAIVREICSDKSAAGLIVDVIMAAFTETMSKNKLYDLIITDIEDHIMAATIDMETSIYDKAMQAAPGIVRSLLPGLYTHRFNEATRISPDPYEVTKTVRAICENDHEARLIVQLILDALAEVKIPIDNS